MKNKSSDSNKLPQMPVIDPSLHGASGSQKESNHDDYTIKTQVASMKSKFSGKGQALEVTISKEELAELEMVKEIFGKDFGVNQIICFAFNSIEKGIVKKSLLERFSGLVADRKTLKIKPNEGSLTAIISMGKENSASILTRIGIQVLYEKFSANRYDA